jgi:glutamate synthase (NADPH/NADH) small chain
LPGEQPDPGFNDLVYRGQWKTALENLQSTNNFPEFTVRICPAPCEASCTLNIPDTPVTIKTIECQIIDRGWDEGWITPQPSARGSASAWPWWVRAGGHVLRPATGARRHATTVFEKSDRIGGLLRYGIPDFKMEKHLIDRRVRQMEPEGVIFRDSFEVGVTVSVQRLLGRLRRAGDGRRRGGPAPAWACRRGPLGRPRRHGVPDPAEQAQRRRAGGRGRRRPGTLSAKGTARGGDRRRRHGSTASAPRTARRGSVVQLEIMPQPPVRENKAADCGPTGR